MFLNFLFSLIFCIQGGQWVFGLFDSYSGSIQLLTCFLMELILLPWVFGMGRLSTLMELRTGEKIPKFVVYMIKFFIPTFIFAIYIISWVTEFQYKESREEQGWTVGITWGARMIMFVPMLLIPIGYFKRIDCTPIDDIIAQQYGIKCERDGTYIKLDNFNNGEPMEKINLGKKVNQVVTDSELKKLEKKDDDDENIA